jgi:hypothetical protein
MALPLACAVAWGINRIILWSYIPYGGDFVMSQSWFIQARAAWLWKVAPVHGLFYWASVLELVYAWRHRADAIRMISGICGSWPLMMELLVILGILMGYTEVPFVLGLMGVFVSMGIAGTLFFGCIADRIWKQPLIAFLINGLWCAQWFWYVWEWLEVFGD